jgi:hypothetical protein
MTSTVTNFSNQINPNFPVAGSSNNSQTFRSNFSNIQNALSIAANEITQLQVNGVNTANPVNDLAFNTTIVRAQFQNSGLVANNSASTGANISGVIPIDYSLGSYQSITLTSGTNLFSVMNWPPSGVYGNVRVVINSLNTTTINFDTSLSNNPGNTPISNDIPYLNTVTNSFSTWDLWTSDGGDNVFVNLVSAPHPQLAAATGTYYSSGKVSGANGLSLVSGLTGTINGTSEVSWQIIGNIATVKLGSIYGLNDPADTDAWVEFTGLPSEVWPASSGYGGFGAIETAILPAWINNTLTNTLVETRIYGANNSAGVTAGNIRIYPLIGSFTTGTVGLYGGVMMYSLV